VNQVVKTSCPQSYIDKLAGVFCRQVFFWRWSGNMWIVVGMYRDSVPMFCPCLEWQWVKHETVSSIACSAHRSLLAHGVMNMSGMV